VIVMKSRDIQGLAEKYEFSMKQIKSLLKRFKAEAGGNNSNLELTKLLCLPEFLSNPVASAFLCRYFEENSTEVVKIWDATTVTQQSLCYKNDFQFWGLRICHTIYSSNFVISFSDSLAFLYIK